MQLNLWPNSLKMPNISWVVNLLKNHNVPALR